MSRRDCSVAFELRLHNLDAAPSCLLFVLLIAEEPVRQPWFVQSWKDLLKLIHNS